MSPPISAHKVCHSVHILPYRTSPLVLFVDVTLPVNLDDPRQSVDGPTLKREENKFVYYSIKTLFIFTIQLT